MTSPATQRPQNSSTHSPLENFIDGVANFLHLPVSGTAHDQSTSQNAEKAVTLGHFSGKLANGGQSMTLFLKLKSGKLIGTYQAPSGKKYDVQGTLTGQQTISLQTTAQDVHIEIVGMLTKDQFVGTLSNPKHGYVSSFSLKSSGAAAPAVTPKLAQQAETPAAAATSAAGGTAETPADPNVKPWQQTLSAKNRDKLPALKEPGFLPALNVMCKRLGIEPDMLMAIMTFESATPGNGTRGLDPKGYNGQGYFGLIQFGPDAAEDANLKSAEKFVGMSAVQQLPYVEEYLKRHGLAKAQARAKQEGRKISLEELYMSILGGNTSAAHDPYWRKQGSSGYNNNAGLDSNHDGIITATEAADAVRLHWRDVYGNNIDTRSQHLERQWYVEGGKRKWRAVEHSEIYSPVLNGPASTGAGAATPAQPTDQTGSTSPPTATAPATAPAAAPATTPAAAPAATASAGTQAHGSAPDPRLSVLDKLMGLTQHKVTYEIEEIQRARALIMQQPEAQRKALFLDLQSKVQYHNQRNNQATENGQRVETLGGEMCNVTSLAMVLETLGIGKPKSLKEHQERCIKNAPRLNDEQLSSMQYEDYLDLIRHHYGLGDRTHQDTLGRIAAKMGAKWELMCAVGGETYWKRAEWEEKAGGALGSGSGVIFSIAGHIVRLQGMDDDGLVVDDPYGKAILGTGRSSHWHGFSESNNQSNGGKAGSDSVWAWNKVERHVLWWMAKVTKV